MPKYFATEVVPQGKAGKRLLGEHPGLEMDAGMAAEMP